MQLTESLQNNLVRALGYGRLGLFTLESLPIIETRRRMGLAVSQSPTPPLDHLKMLRQTVSLMIDQDRKNIKEGVYPLSLILPESPVQHARRYLKILKDNFYVSRRFQQQKHQEFSESSKEYMKDLPEYYTRNFHNQTDGYLSEESAELYTHQTEILFKGSIALMRRLLLADVIRFINSQEGKVKVLELGCGHGDSTEILLKSCPNVEMVAVDLSEPYLKIAKKRLRNFSNIKYVHDKAETLDLESSFDLVLSSFLFHEVPRTVREEILARGVHHLKRGGRMVHIDSLQMGDREEFDWALVQFPKDFHEPFYKNYVNTPMEDNLPPEMVLHSVDSALLAKSVTSFKK